MMSSVLFSCSRLAQHRFQHSYSTISVTVDKGLRVIKLQRPDKFNAFNNEMYNEVLEDLHAAAEDDQTAVGGITGVGKYFSSGNDLNSFAAVSQDLEERKEFSPRTSWQYSPRPALQRDTWAMDTRGGA